MVRVTCRVSRYGAHRDYQIDIPADGKGPQGGNVMSRTHATVSATTYGMRTLERLIFNLPVKGQRNDDDGNAASGAPKTINAAQLKRIKALIVSSKADTVRFLEYMAVEKVEDILTKDFNKALDMLDRKVKANAKNAREAKKKLGNHHE
jgi:hypothetical protein